MNLENIILFAYDIFPIIKKYRVYRLNKYLEPVNISGFEKTKDKEEIEVTRKLIETKNEEYRKAYEDFKKVLEENFESDDLVNFYYNSEWVSVYRVNYDLNPFCFISGRYDHIKNKLFLNKKNLKKSSNHEFFHMGSTNHNSVYQSSGFSIDIHNQTLGNGINEGYTDLLTQRYFNENIEESYSLESRFASNLEKIIGQKKMEKLYLKGNFFEFVKELEKYYDIEEIEKFLINIDVISALYSSYLSEEEAKKINLLIEDCICFLLKGFCKVLKNKKISKQDKKLCIENYFDNIRYFYSYREQRYLFNIKRINGIIEQNLSKEVIIDSYPTDKMYNKKVI